MGRGFGWGGGKCELYEFVVGEGKWARVEVNHGEVGRADEIKDVSFVMGGEGDMLGDREIVQ